MSYKSISILLLAVFVLHFSRILFHGEIIFPHDNSLEVGLSETRELDRISNRKFSDESSVFIPELANNLRYDCKAWLATWNPHVELGRPAFQGALSRAFLLTNLLSWFTSNPFILYTILILLTVGLTATFFLLFLRSLGLHPVACACAAIGLAFTTATSYWLCFVMFVSATCWLVCLLWLITEFTKKPSWTVAVGLAFAIYCLLIAGYPQVTILFAYIAGPYALIRLVQMPGRRREKLWTMLAMFGCAVAGVLASLPVFLDLLFTAQDSARLGDVSDSFFLGVLPQCRSPRDVASFLMTLFDGSWLGNAIDPKYPLHFNGLSFTPIYGSLIWLSFLLKNKRAVLFWQLVLIVCLAGTIFPAVYLFAVHHLGFGLSRIQLLGGGIIPGFVLSAFALDAILHGDLQLTMRSGAWLLAPLVVESVVALSIWQRFPIDALAVVASFLLVAALLVSIYWRSVPGFIAIAVVSAFFYGRALILSRPLRSIHTSSKLIDAIKAHTPDGSRFAIADSPITALPPNQEALFDLNSVNSYDSLSSRRYQAVVNRWSVSGARTYGRHFRFLDIESAFADPAFSFSNVEVVLSKRSLRTDRLKLATEVNGIKLYETTAAPIELLQTPDFNFSNGQEAAVDTSAGRANLPLHRAEMLNDFQRIEVTASSDETLLFLSQQYHRRWLARSQNRALRTVIANGFYQGVVLPPNTSEVELWFRPFVLWGWLPQVLFIACAVLLILRQLMRIERGKMRQLG